MLTRPRAGCRIALVALAIGVVVIARPSHVATAGHQVSYVLTPKPDERVLDVAVTFEQVSGPLEVHVSRSSPGRYGLHLFARNVFGMAATNGSGAPLSLEPLGTHRWRLAGHDGTVHLRYSVYGDRVDGTYLAVDRTHAHVNPPAALAWAPAFAESPVQVTIARPPGREWRVATQLFPTVDPWSFTAPNLAYLMDSPIEVSAFDWRTFTADLPTGESGPAPTIAVALHGNGATADELDALVRDLRAVTREEAAVFGEYPPYEGGRYTFLADMLPWAMGDGMEHRNSTVLTTSASLAGGRGVLVDAAAHEFFHGWNVERIRPRGLEPFDLDDENVTGELWLAEGVTSYYEALVQVRAGIDRVEAFADTMGRAVDEIVSGPARTWRSAADMSRLAPLVDGPPPGDRTNLNLTFVSYYTYGAALGLGFDLAIREHTAGARSLDDLMRTLWIRHGRPGGERPGEVRMPYTAADVRECLGEVAGDPGWAAELMRRYVEGREAMDYRRLLAQAGLVLRPRSSGRASLGALGIERTGGRLRVAAPVPPGSPAAALGLGQDDEIIAIEHRPVGDAGTLDQALGRYRPGQRVTVTVQLRGEPAPRDLKVTLAAEARLEIVTSEAAGRPLDGAARQFRSRWLGPR